MIMLSSTQKEKLIGNYQWDKLQKKADFNHYMSRKLKQRLKDLKDLILLLENLPGQVLKNINLIEDLPQVIEFVNLFLAKAKPLPVGEHESGEMRIFCNVAKKMETHPNVDDWEKKGYLRLLNGDRYLIDSASMTASPGEIRRWELLKTHMENIQEYIDPCTVIAMDWHPSDIFDVELELRNRADMMGQCRADLRVIKETIPTNPPRQPRIIIKEKNDK